MKKIFTLLAFIVVTVNAAAQTYLNVGDPDLYGFDNSQDYRKSVIEKDRMNFPGYTFYYYDYSSSQTGMDWIDRSSTDVTRQTNSTGWVTTDIFKGHSYFSSYSACNATGNLYRKVSFNITNCKQIDVLLYRNNSYNSQFSNFYEFKITATPQDGTVLSTTKDLSATSTSFYPSLSGLDYTKKYTIELQIPANTSFHEISFVINNFAPTVTKIDGKNWGTMYLDYPVRIPTNEHSTLHAYTINAISDNTVSLSDVSDYIPANTGVLLWEEVPNDKSIIFTETGKNIAEVSPNFLKGTTADNFTVGDALYGKPSTAKVLTLGRSGGMLGFFIYNGTLGKNKAYLLYDYGDDSPISVKGFYISGFDDMTDIQTVESESTETGNWYSLQGVRLNARPTQRGIYLNNGKKVLVK